MLLKNVQKELNIEPTSLDDWLESKLKNKIKRRSNWENHWHKSQLHLQWDK